MDLEFLKTKVATIISSSYELRTSWYVTRTLATDDPLPVYLNIRLAGYKLATYVCIVIVWSVSRETSGKSAVMVNKVLPIYILFLWIQAGT